ncbi:MAG: hypothetical protein GC154_00485 [bacterium]|nr:hypothetical protein [bacterium]
MNRFFLLISIAAASIISAVAAGESAVSLFQQGNAALAAGDYVSAAYYYQRVRESDEWPQFSDKADLLGKLGLVEEGQSRFEHAAYWYGELVDWLDKNPNSGPGSFYPYYRLRYADCLERAGDYKRAASILWDQYEKTEAAVKPAIVERLVQNYQFRECTPEEMTALRQAVMANGVQTLGWNLAELYQQKQQYEESFALYQDLWPQAPNQAQDHLDSMIETYRATNHLDDLVNAIQERLDQGENPNMLLLLECDILRRLDRGEEALQRMERFLAKLAGVENLQSARSLIGRAPGSMIQSWIDLVQRIRGDDAAVELMKGWIEAQPSDVLLRERLANLYANTGRLDDAVALWRDWAASFSGDAVALLHAVDQLSTLGAQDAAAKLLEEASGEIPPQYAFRQAQSALRTGRFNDAIAELNVASVSGQTSPAAIEDAVQKFAQSAPDAQALFDAMVERATGVTYAEIPLWMRNSIETVGAQLHQNGALSDLARAEPSGVWRIELARGAAQRGDRDWALDLLNSVDRDSPYYVSAEREKALLLSEAFTLPDRREAVSLMRTSLEPFLSESSRIPLSQILVERLLTFAEIALDAYAPADALGAVGKIESASNELDQPMSPPAEERLHMARARAWMEQAQWPKALDLFNTIQIEPYATDAAFYSARIQLGLEETDAARDAFQAIVEDPARWRRANDALEELTALEPLVGEALELYSRAALYELQGRFADAIPLYRQIAVDHFGDDAEERALYTAGLNEWREGDVTGAREQWKRLSVDVDHPVIHGMIRWNLWRTRPASGDVGDLTGYQDLLLEFPDTLFADLARLEMQERNRQDQP